MSSEATARRDEPVAVSREQLPVHSGLVIEPFEKREAREFDEIAITARVLCEQGQVVIHLPTVLGVAAGVIDASASTRTLASAFVRHVRLGADDRRDAVSATLAVEIQHSVHVSVIGDAERGLTIASSRLHQFVQAGGPVQHGILRVDVKVGERIAHSGYSFPCDAERSRGVSSPRGAPVSF